MSWQERLKGDSLSWLCEPDPVNPAIRYFALRDLLDRPVDDPEVLAAQSVIMAEGPVPVILGAQHPDGYWQQPGTGYESYQGTLWQIILLSELGADPADVRVRRGCDYALDYSIASNGGIAHSERPAPSSVVHCLNGNVLYALIRLGWLNDWRVQRILEWQARAITGEEPFQYYQSSTCGPDFACAANGKQPCGWGATKAMKALSAAPPEQRTPVVQRAVERGVQFLLRYDLAKANYPYIRNVSSTWFKLGFPLSYWSDLLETLAVLVALGYGDDPRLAEVYDWLLSKQDAQGRWKLENSLNGKMWIDIEQKGAPSKWITLRVLRVLKSKDRL
jgi:hypothetical protein